MNIPNVLTVLRIFLTVVFAMLSQVSGLAGACAVFIVFMFAVLTDFLDGYIARKYRLITVFGQIMDPIADKMLTLTAMFIFAFEGTILLWMVAVVAAREILVTAVRIYALTNGKVLPAESAGKWKTALQMGVVLMVLGYRVCAVLPPAREFVEIHQNLLSGVINGVMMVAVILTAWSGLLFFNNLSRDKE